MERVCGRPARGWYLAGAGTVFLVWLAAPSLTAGLPAIFYLLAACCCLLHLLCGHHRRGCAAGWLLLALAILMAESEWLPLVLSPSQAGWLHLLFAQVVIGCLMLIPTFHWLGAAPLSPDERSFFPPPECALAVFIVIAESIALTLFMPGVALVEVARLAETSLAIIFLCWCCSIALKERFGLEIGETRTQWETETAAARRELLREAVRAARAHHVSRLHRHAAARGKRVVEAA
jgi:hypothetical protein